MVYASSRFQPTQPNTLLLHNNSPNVQHKSNLGNIVGNARTIIWELALEFGQGTTIHGVNRLLKRGAGKYERAVWLLTVLLALLGVIFVCHILSERFSEGKLETIIETTRMPVYRIVFPTVSICNFNMLNWQRLPEAKRQYLPADTSHENELLFERIVKSYDGLNFVKLDEFGVLQGEPLEQLDNVNFSKVVDFMTWRCEELLTQCYWNRLPMNCCEIFSKRRSKNGVCWSFNSLETDEGRRMKLIDPMWPWHTGSTGPGSGLLVKVLINPEKHVPNRHNEKGVNVMISEPTVWHNYPLKVPADTYTMIIVEPVVSSYDNNTRALNPKLRQCFFIDEQNSGGFKTLTNFPYMIENCQAECHQEYMTRYCNCTMDLLFPPGSFTPCKASSLPCLAKNSHIFRYSHQTDAALYVRHHNAGMQCKCFRNCYSLKYMTDARSSYLSSEMRGNLSYIDLDVHLRFDVIMVYSTRLSFGWVDLMVAFGGIAGLFLGCSLISAMELGYFLFVEVPSFIAKKVTKKGLKKRPPQKLFQPNANKIEQWSDKQLVTQQPYEHLFANGRKRIKPAFMMGNWPPTHDMKNVNQY